jgi:23S rRNA pseudouridine2605 synthase
MRLNQFLAKTTDLSRRNADKAISEGRVLVNSKIPALGQGVEESDKVELDGKLLPNEVKVQTIQLNKPFGYVVSRDGQGSKTVYDLIPENLSNLKPIGRLDRNSTGLLLMTNDGHLNQKLSHPSNNKMKVYNVKLDKILEDEDKQKIEEGVFLEDGYSRLKLLGGNDKWQVSMSEGRNRQIRRTFDFLGYKVIKLHRVSFGDYDLGDQKIGDWIFV